MNQSMCLLAYPTVLIWDSKSGSTSTQGTIIRPGIWSLERSVFVALLEKIPKKKKRKAGVFKSHIFRFQQWHSFGSSTQNTMAGTWKFHRFKREEDHRPKKRGHFLGCVLRWFFTTWDSSLIFHRPLGRNCWLEQNLLVGLLFPNIKQSQIQVFGAVHNVSSHGTHIFRSGSIYNFTHSNSCPGGGPFVGMLPLGAPPKKKGDNYTQ